MFADRQDADPRRQKSGGERTDGMTFNVIADSADKGKTYTVEVLARKFNGVWTKWRTSVAFVCYSDIQIVEMSDEEKAMPIYMKPGYPGRGY